MKKLNVYVVDDDVFYLKSVILGLNAEYSDSVMFRYFFNANELIAKLKGGEEEYPDYVLLDYNLDSRDSLHGVEVIQAIKKISPKIEVVVVSAQNNNQIALTVIKAGATSYVQKSVEMLSEIRRLLDKAIKKKGLKGEKKPLFTLMVVVVVALVISVACLFFFLWND